MSRWPVVAFREILAPNRRPYLLGDNEDANLVGMRLYGGGPFHRQLKPAGQIRKKSHFVIRQGDVIYNKLFAWKGTFGIVPPELDGMLVSDKFPTYEFDRARVNPNYLRWYFRCEDVWEQARRLSIGSAALSKLTLNPPMFLELTMPLPPVEEQRRVVEHLDRLSRAIGDYHEGVLSRRQSLEAMLSSAFRRMTKSASWFPLGDVAPIVRRPIAPVGGGSYPELGIRSFGKGTFHKPAVTTEQLGSKRLFTIRAGDLMFSNVFSWEGAVAVATDADDGRYGSHRFISCVPDPARVRPHFLRYYFLSPQGLSALGVASPGSAGRNRTLGTRKLETLKVPTPPVPQQERFESLLAYVEAVFTIDQASLVAAAAALTSALTRAMHPPI